jgi:exosortase/archaeosortase family protein
MATSRITMEWMGYPIQFFGTSNIRFVGGRGVHIGYDCIGYGVLSFWAAFILANQASLGKKIKWLMAGLVVIFTINVFRINLLLLSVNRNWASSLQMDNHFWFNVFAYTAIFTMIYLYDKQGRARSHIA